MSLDKKLFKAVATTTTTTSDAAQGLVLHLDANDEDSIEQGGANDGNTNGTWFDISTHDLNVPRIDPASDLKLELNFSDTSSYSGSGTPVEDVSPEGTDYDGTINGNVTYGSDTVGYITFDDNPRSSFVTIGSTGDFDLDDGDATIELWVYRTSTSEQDIISTTVDGASNGFGIFWSSTGYYIIERATAARVQTGTSGAATGVWEHVVFTWDKSALSFNAYLNGTKSNTNQVNGSGTIGAVSRSLDLHNHGAAAGIGKFTGRFNSVRWYTRILTGSEIAQNYRAGCFFSYGSYITSRDSATQGTLHTSNLQIDLDANSYSGSGNWLDGANDYDASVTSSHATYVNDNNSDYFDISGIASNPISISHNNILNAAARTWEFWVWFDADTMSFFGGQWSSTASEKVIMFRMKDGNNAIRAQCYSGSSGYSASEYLEPTTDNNVVNINEWNHIVFTSDNSSKDFKIYVNGVEKYSNTLQFNINTSSSLDFMIGGVYSSSNLDGRIAQFRYYNAALSSSEVNTNYNATKALYQNPLLTMHLDAGDETTVSASTWSDKANSNDGALTNFSSTLSDFYDKELGNSIDFDGSDDRIELAANSQLYMTSNTGFSWAVWVNRDSDSEMYIISSKGSPYYHVLAWYSSSLGYGGAIQGSSYVSGTHTGFGTTATNGIGNWDYVVLTHSASDRKNRLYVNGILEGTRSTVHSGFHTDTQNINIGAYHNNAAPFNGKIGVVKAYKSELTANEVAQNYLATKNDYPNGNHATNNGATFTYSSTPYYFDFVSNDYFRTPSIPITWTSGFAYEIYFQADSNTQSYLIGTSGVQPMLSWRNFGGWKLVAFHYNSSGGNDYLESDATSTGQWYHIVYTANDSGGQIYTNGSLSDSSSNSVITGDYNDYLDIARAGGGNYLDGKIGMVKIHAKHLSSTEVSANYDATKSTYGLS